MGLLAHFISQGQATGGIVAPPPTEPEPGETVVYSKPIVITEGGTYEGDWKSDDPATPAVTIKTTQPVIIENSNLSYRGYGIKSALTGVDVTVRRTNGICTTPITSFVVDGRLVKEHGHNFIHVTSAKNLKVEHCFWKKSGGIEVFRFTGNGTINQTVKIGYNEVEDNITRHMVRLHRVVGVANMEIYWNQYIGLPGLSAVEDIINVYMSSGTPASPLRIHNNFLKGSYPYPSTKTTASGSGIITDSATSLDPLVVTNNVFAYENQVVATSNGGMNISAGNNILYRGNTIVNSGYLPDGTPYGYGNAGVSIFNYRDRFTSETFYNNKMENNTIGYVKRGYTEMGLTGRNDIDNKPGTVYYNDITGTKHLPNPVTLATEAAEYQYWLNKLASNNINIGI